MRQERPLDQCTRWFDTLATHLPHLSRAQRRTLALWSFAATLTQHIGSTTCAAFLARLFDQPFSNWRQRLREFYWEAPQKRGSSRRALTVEACFAPLLRWILTLYRANQLILALDATLVRDRLAVLSVSVVFRGSALPVAWRIMPANQKGAWIAPCQALFKQLSAAVPEAMEVLVLCDRGLQSRRLFEAITRQGWHPMLRLVRLGLWRETRQQHWHALATLLPGPGRYYLGRGHLFKTNPLECTLLALWEEGYEEPWLLATDLAPQRCAGSFSASCYGLRSWIEQGFRCLKSGAYRCERLRMTDPVRVERVWLVMAVSLIWTHAIGSASQGAEISLGGELSGLFQEGVRRVLGVHRSGWIELLVTALRGEKLPLPERLMCAPRPGLPPGLLMVLTPPP